MNRRVYIQIFFISILCIILTGWTSAASENTETSILLDPIVKAGTPGDVLGDDAIVSSVEGSVGLNSGNGSILNSLQNQLAMPVSDFGQPGIAQVRGLALSAEDVDVQMLGISLNPPQGGGFNLSVFPQYLWSGYQYQLGPALNALNPSASAGTLRLMPWSAQALREPGEFARGTAFVSSQGVTQASASVAPALQGSRSFAMVGGYSSLNVTGPSAAVSGKWGLRNYSGTVHLLATDLEAVSAGPHFAPTPQAKIRNTRVIPLLQNDWSWGLNERGVFKNSLFYDWARMEYRDSDAPTNRSQDWIQQWGVENVYLIQSWKFGVSARQISFREDSVYSDLHVPIQTFIQTQVGRTFEWGSWTLEPLLQMLHVTDLGLQPQGSWGMRHEWDRGLQAVFSKWTLSKKVPTLMDRYMTAPDFIGNQNLQTETDWTFLTGIEFKRKRVSADLQAYAQFKQNTRVYSANTVLNLNDASIFAVTGTGQVRVFHEMEGVGSVTVSKSFLPALGTAFPYLPDFQTLTGVHFFDRKERPHWEGNWMARWMGPQVGRSSVSGGGLLQIPSFLVWDFGLQFSLGRGICASGRVENLFNRTIEVIQGYPLGRSASLTIGAAID